MEAYEGCEPYIFISYARADSDKVRPFLEALSNVRYRVWWDKGIEAGADWLKKLFAKVEGCEVFCPLFSEAFLASTYCFMETAWAYHNEKNIVPLYLEELKEDNFRGFYRLLRKLQGLLLYDCANAAEFVDGLGREQAFMPCKKPEWNTIGMIQWRLDTKDGALWILKNGAYGAFPAFIPPYQWEFCREKIRSVEIDGNIEKIGDYAFDKYENLTNADIKNGVKEIGNHAFARCKSLPRVRIPDSVRQIDAFAFQGCKSLQDVSIPRNVKKISNYVFSGCGKLTKIVIPDSATEIGVGAFWGCASLTEISIPNSVTKIGDSAFKNCKSLTEIVIPDSVTEIAPHAFENCKSLSSVRIPDSVTKIGYHAFVGCESLTSVEIPAGAYIKYAFSPCTSPVIRRPSPEQSQ